MTMNRCGSLAPTVGVGRVSSCRANSTGGSSKRYRLARPTTRQARSLPAAAAGTAGGGSDADGAGVAGGPGAAAAGAPGEGTLSGSGFGMRGRNVALKLSWGAAL